MAIEQIKLIRDAEEQAELIRKKSNLDARQMVVDAEFEAQKLLEEANRKGEEGYKSTLQRANVEAESAYEDIISKAKQEIHHMTAAAEENVNSAVSMIIGKVVK